MNSTNNRNASAAASARELGLSAAYPLNIVKDEPTSVSQIAAVGLPSPHQFSSAGVSVEKPHKTSSGTPASTVSDPSMKDYSHKMNNFAPKPGQSSHQQASFRRGIRPQLPGDWHDSCHQNHMGRREHDHLDCNPHTTFSGRDAQHHHHMHPTMINPRNCISLTPRGVSFIPAAPLPMFSAGAGDNLYSIVAKLIECYFSQESLTRNCILLQHMNEEGWVPISLIAGFHQVKQLVKGVPSIQFILQAVRGSEIVETKHDMIRKRNDWNQWISSPTNPEMKTHLQSSNREGRSEGDKIKDRLQELAARDKFEDIHMGFSKFTSELPMIMDEDDKKMVVEAMEALRRILQEKCNVAKDNYGNAAKTYSEAITQLTDRHPDFLDDPSFQELLSDDYKNRCELLDAKIAGIKLKMQADELDEVHLKILRNNLLEDQCEPLLNDLLNWLHIIQSVDSYIRIVAEKDIA